VVRQLSARALGNFGAQASDAVPSLVDAIKNGDKDLRNAAADGLAKIPAKAENSASLTELLGDEIDSARMAAAKSLGGLGEGAVAALPTLEKLSKEDKNDAVREAAAHAVRSIKRPHASR
jgi:HEAT repeat protein